jgi:hypothetical protein
MPCIDAAVMIEVHPMKKFLILLTLVVGVTTMASMKAAGSGPVPKANVAADLREARACAVLLKKMSQSPAADTWRNRMRAWSCRQRSDTARERTAEAR